MQDTSLQLLGSGSFSDAYADYDRGRLVFKPSQKKIEDYTSTSQSKKIRGFKVSWRKMMLRYKQVSTILYDSKATFESENSCLVLENFPIGQPLAELSELKKENKEPSFRIDEAHGKKLFGLLGKLHGYGIRHNDIRRSNIILKRREAFLVDFGSSMHVSQSNDDNTEQAELKIVKINEIKENDDDFYLHSYNLMPTAVHYDLNIEFDRLFHVILVDVVAKKQLKNNEVHCMYNGFKISYLSSKSIASNQALEIKLDTELEDEEKDPQDSKERISRSFNQSFSHQSSRPISPLNSRKQQLSSQMLSFNDYSDDDSQCSDVHDVISSSSEIKLDKNHDNEGKELQDRKESISRSLSQSSSRQLLGHTSLSNSRVYQSSLNMLSFDNSSDDDNQCYNMHDVISSSSEIKLDKDHFNEEKDLQDREEGVSRGLSQSSSHQSLGPISPSIHRICQSSSRILSFGDSSDNNENGCPNVCDVLPSSSISRLNFSRKRSFDPSHQESSIIKKTCNH